MIGRVVRSATHLNRRVVLPQAISQSLGGCITDSQVGLSRREPSLHFASDRRVARSPRSAHHLVPPRRLEQPLRDSQRQERAHQHGHEPAIRVGILLFDGVQIIVAPEQRAEALGASAAQAQAEREAEETERNNLAVARVILYQHLRDVAPIMIEA